MEIAPNIHRIPLHLWWDSNRIRPLTDRHRSLCPGRYGLCPQPTTRHFALHAKDRL